jgi:hypothetical protein
MAWLTAAGALYDHSSYRDDHNIEARARESQFYLFINYVQDAALLAYNFRFKNQFMLVHHHAVCVCNNY